MKFNKLNKAAWEEAFYNRKIGWGDDIYDEIKKEGYPFLEKVLIKELNNFDLNGKTIAQFCCNNGRELLSLFKMGAKYGVGFDIAENMISFANATVKRLDMNCTFVATDILDIDRNYYEFFDYIFITVGAIGWFENLEVFFEKVYNCLKDGGHLIINEMHPLTNMLAMSGEENYDMDSPNKLVNSYFKSEPWIGNNGISYMSDSSKNYKETFHSYSHTFTNILNALIKNNLKIKKLQEFEYDATGAFLEINKNGIPLSYILIAKK
jgi:SAM-dependent methyltransferase